MPVRRSRTILVVLLFFSLILADHHGHGGIVAHPAARAGSDGWLPKYLAAS